jgi:uncharacterized membrane protein YgaE (UPF0421/DUF939 family)
VTNGHVLSQLRVAVPRDSGRSMAVTSSSPKAGTGRLLRYSVEVGLASLLSYWAATRLWSTAHQPYEEGQLGGMWAAISTIFVVRECKRKSAIAAIARMSATLISFVLYLAFLPFHAWGLALLVGLSVLVPGLIGRPGDEATAAITTTVVMVVAGLNPHGAWKQPLLRLADTAIGVAAGLVTLVIVHQIGKWTGRGSGPPSDRSPTSQAG